MKKISVLILLICCLTIRTQAQIPNAGFESWTQVGNYFNPDGWDNMNALTAGNNIFTCERGAPGSAGSYYLSITSRTVPGMGVVPGKAVSGIMDHVTYSPLSGFAFTQRPESLNGKWQHMVFGGSQGYVEVFLTKWDAGSHIRNIIAMGNLPLAGMVHAWTPFKVTLAYQSSEAPDSCIIVLSASGSAPANQDFLWVDELSFAGEVSGIEGNELQSPALQILTLNDSHHFLAKVFMPGQASAMLSIYDMTGRLVFTTTQYVSNGQQSMGIPFYLPDSGMFLVSISTSGITLRKKLIIP